MPCFGRRRKTVPPKDVGQSLHKGEDSSTGQHATVYTYAYAGDTAVFGVCTQNSARSEERVENSLQFCTWETTRGNERLREGIPSLNRRDGSLILLSRQEGSQLVLPAVRRGARGGGAIVRGAANGIASGRGVDGLGLELLGRERKKSYQRTS